MFYKIRTGLSLGVLFLQTCLCQQLFLGKCPAATPITNFDAPQYLGLWFEYGKYFTVFELGGRCVEAIYTDNGNGNIGVMNKQINFLGKPSTISGVAVPVNAGSTEAKFTVSFPSVPFSSTTASSNGNYWVIATDYANYAVVWDCEELPLFNIQFLWVLTRTQIPSAEVIATATSQITSAGLNTALLIKTQQTGCSSSST